LELLHLVYEPVGVCALILAPLISRPY